MIKKRSFGFALSGAMISLVLCSVCLANEFYGGNEYICNTEYNENYIYEWSASSGSYTENNKNTFAWTAPEVNSPTDVALSVSVVDKRCGCQKNFDTAITVLPSKEIKLQVLSNDTENSTSIILADNNTFPDPETDNPENITDQANLTAVAPSPSSKLDDSSATDLVKDSGTTDNTSLTSPGSTSTLIEPETQPAPEQAEKNNSNDAIWTIPLDFGDGTEVDVVVAESSPGEFAASVESDEENLQFALEEAITENLTSLENDGVPPTLQNLNQTGNQSVRIIQTETPPPTIKENKTEIVALSSEEDEDVSESDDNQLDANQVSLEQPAIEATPSNNATLVATAESEISSA